MMSQHFAEYDHIILQEMLVHPALFTHHQTKTVAVLGEHSAGIVEEALKHAHLTTVWQITKNKSTATNDARLQILTNENHEWLTKIAPDSVDILIVSDTKAELTPNLCQQYLSALQTDGLLIQISDSIFNVAHLKNQIDAMLNAGFKDTQILHFPQPGFPSGSRVAIMGVKHGSFKRVREKDIFNKHFMTRYYNFDVHKAASVMPEFLREKLAN